MAIIGRNGSGKSTLAKILGGLLYPDSGEYLINGKKIQELNPKTLRGLIGMVFQDPDNQIIAAMVEDDVAFAPENQGLPSNEIQKRVDAAIEKVNLTHKKFSSVTALSGGEKQRLAIAGALAAKIECLILDEATSMLDPKGRADIEKALKDLHSEGLTIIQITHDLEPENFKDVNRVIIISNGEIKWQGSPEEFFKNIAALYETPVKPPESNSRYKGEARKIFQIKDLFFKYDEKNYALKNLSQEIFSGQWLSIIGKTGSGKSTLVQHLNALYKIQEGKIFFEGKDLPQSGQEVHRLRKRVGLVFQHPEDQLFSATVKDELAFAPSNAGLKNSELDEAILYGLECVGLEKNFLTRNPIALSGGERRLVAIASVLSARPECFVLDEPLAGLDASYRIKILSMLARLRNEGKTIITITHDLKMALEYSDKILFLEKGEKKSSGTPEEIQELIKCSFQI